MKITKIEIETIGEHKVKLTIEEARELYGQLHELFGEKESQPSMPIIIDRYPWWTPNPYITWSASGFVYEGSSGIKASFISE